MYFQLEDDFSHTKGMLQQMRMVFEQEMQYIRADNIEHKRECDNMKKMYDDLCSDGVRNRRRVELNSLSIAVGESVDIPGATTIESVWEASPSAIDKQTDNDMYSEHYDFMRSDEYFSLNIEAVDSMDDIQQSETAVAHANMGTFPITGMNDNQTTPAISQTMHGNDHNAQERLSTVHPTEGDGSPSNIYAGTQDNNQHPGSNKPQLVRNEMGLIVCTFKKKIGYKRHCEIEICEKTFKVPSQYYSHIRVHTGEKPYACEICNRKFTHKVSCVYHEKSTHGIGMSFECEKCKEKFVDSIRLEHHQMWSCQVRSQPMIPGNTHPADVSLYQNHQQMCSTYAPHPHMT